MKTSESVQTSEFRSYLQVFKNSERSEQSKDSKAEVELELASCDIECGVMTIHWFGQASDLSSQRKEVLVFQYMRTASPHAKPILRVAEPAILYCASYCGHWL